MRTFFYTNSFDLSTDLLIRRLGSERVFRFNLDSWKEYAIDIGPDRLTITNPAGVTVQEADIAKFLWRKPCTSQQLHPDRSFPREQRYEEDELAYAMREVWSRMYHAGRAVLIDPLSDELAGKFVQARIAGKYFSVPPWRFAAGAPHAFRQNHESVVKSLTSQRVGDKSVLYTTRVREDELSPSSPWMIQELVEADRDVTVVFIRGDLFAFEFERGTMPERVLDWRQARARNPQQTWRPHRLPAVLAEGIAKFIDAMALHYGRLDFLLSGENYWFLEVNPNGEWGWLDPDGKAGVLDKLADELSPDTPCHPLPNPRSIRVL